MADSGVGGLPVVRGRVLVGIITESDLFRVFIELFGARQKGVRLAFHVPNQKGALAKITAAITAAGGNIIAMGTFLGEDPTRGLCTVKVDGIGREALLAAVTPLALGIDDVREV